MTLYKAISCKSWQRELVNLAGVTDSYQHAEENYCLMPAALIKITRHSATGPLATGAQLSFF